VIWVNLAVVVAITVLEWLFGNILVSFLATAAVAAALYYVVFSKVPLERADH